MLASLGGGEGVQFDAMKFTYLGRPTADDRLIFVGAKSPIKSMQDVIALGRPFKVPSQGVDDDFYGMAMLADVLGFTGVHHRLRGWRRHERSRSRATPTGA